MSESKARIVRSLAQTLFPRLDEEAGLARAAGQESMATLLETSASSMDFVIDAVSFSRSSSYVISRVADLVKALQQDGCQLPDRLAGASRRDLRPYGTFDMSQFVL